MPRYKCKDVPKKKCVALIKRGGGGDQGELPPSDRHNLAVSYRDNQVQLMKNNYDNYLSRANTPLRGIAGMLLKLI